MLKGHRAVRAATIVALGCPVLACGSQNGQSADGEAAVTPYQDGSTSPDARSPAPPDTFPAKHCTLAGPPAPTAGESLVWSDEFGGDAVDSRKWYVHDGSGTRVGLLNSFARSAVSVHDGLLHVITSATPDDAEHPFTSGRLDTFGRFARTYGKVEFRARFPFAPGVWYALWGKPQSVPFPEIDFEVLGKDASQVWLVNHWAGEPLPAAGRRKFVIVGGVDVTAFHVYTAVWKPSLLELQIDGRTYMQSTDVGVPETPMSWTINGWVGGWGATKTTPLVPATFEVDYLRIYRLDGLIADPTIRVVNPKTQYAAQSDIDVEPSNFDEACFHVEVYEGATLLETLGPWPYRFRPSRLDAGRHTLTFLATDGARRATTTLDVEIF